jgi:hypothetical protein
MKNTDKLLSLYKEYETILRDKSLDCKEAEDAADDLTGARLRMCRLFRNYLSHQNDPGFLDVSDTMVKFIEGKVTEFKMAEDVLKKHLKPISATCTEKDRCTDVLLKFQKLHTETIVVIVSGGYKTVSIYDVVGLAMESKTRKMAEVKMKKDIIFLPPLTKMTDVPADKTIVCTADGTTEGKFIGVRYPD